MDPNLAQAEALKVATANVSSTLIHILSYIDDNNVRFVQVRTLTEPSISILRRFTTDATCHRLGMKIPLKECFQSMSDDEPVQPMFVAAKQAVPAPRFDRAVVDISSNALLAKVSFLSFYSDRLLFSV